MGLGNDEGRMSALRLHLIRHGETEWSLSGQHTSLTDIVLTARGEHEARALGRGLRGIAFDHVVSSPRQRARRTSELADLGPPVQLDPDLAEWDYGDFEGETTADILVTQPAWDLFRDGCPHGESPAQILDRADRLFTRLRDLAGDVALFTHGQFGAVLAARWIGLPVAQGGHFPLGTASLGVLGYAEHHPGVPVLHRWNARADARQSDPSQTWGEVLEEGALITSPTLGQDAFFPRSNDHPAKAARVDSGGDRDRHETKRLVETIVAWSNDPRGEAAI